MRLAPLRLKIFVLLPVSGGGRNPNHPSERTHYILYDVSFSLSIFLFCCSLVFETLRNLAKPCGTLRSLAEPCGYLRNVAEPCGTLQSLAKPCGTLRNLLQAENTKLKIIDHHRHRLEFSVCLIVTRICVNLERLCFNKVQ